MDRYDDWLRNGRNYRDGEEPEFFEDTHDESGRYVAPDMRRPAPETGRRVAPEGRRSFQSGDGFSRESEPRRGFSQEPDSRRSYERDYAREPESGRGYAQNGDVRRGENDTQPHYTTRNGEKSVYQGPSPLPDKSGYIAPRFYQNVVVYEPRMPEDVQMLIDYLKRREPAIINLNDLEDVVVAQRILDFLSGAEYALGGSVHLIADNIFLFTPEGVEITVPYDI